MPRNRRNGDFFMKRFFLLLTICCPLLFFCGCRNIDLSGGNGFSRFPVYGKGASGEFYVSEPFLLRLWGQVIEDAGDPQDLVIEHLGSTWVITGKWLENLIQDINFDDYEARNYFDLLLRRSGLFDRLEAMGIADGDTVDIYDMQFEYQR